jgi:hypothetical protein
VVSCGDTVRLGPVCPVAPNEWSQEFFENQLSVVRDP